MWPPISVRSVRSSRSEINALEPWDWQLPWLQTLIMDATATLTLRQERQMFFRKKKRPWTFGRFGDELEKNWANDEYDDLHVVMASKHGEHMVIWNSTNHALSMKSADRTTIIAIAATCGENRQKGLQGKDSVGNSTLMFDKFHGINLQAVIHQLGNFHMAMPANLSVFSDTHGHPAMRIKLCNFEVWGFLYTRQHDCKILQIRVFTILKTYYLADARWLIIPQKKTDLLPQSWVLYPATSHNKKGPGPGDSNHHGASVPAIPETILTYVASQIDMGESRPRTIPAEQLSLESDVVRQKLTPVCTKNWPQSAPKTDPSLHQKLTPVCTKNWPQSAPKTDPSLHQKLTPVTGQPMANCIGLGWFNLCHSCMDEKLKDFIFRMLCF